MSKNKKKKPQWKYHIGTAIFMLIGGICGAIMSRYMDSPFNSKMTIGQNMISLGFKLIVIYVLVLLQIIIHEAGHLTFGLMTGYGYSSFRIGNLIWVKENDKLRLRKLSLAGTGGQCLMVPPEMKDGKIPFIMYNLGGSLFNAAFGLIFLGLYYISKDIPLISTSLLISAIIGIGFALVNGIPMRLGMIDNDGYNIISLSKSSEALYSFWIQMKVSEENTKGTQLKDMPKEWFIVPSPEGMKNNMTATIGVFACNWLMDKHEFEEAEKLMKKLLAADTAMVGLHRRLLICDLIYCELIGENRQEKINGLLDKGQKKFMKAMKKFPSVIRTEYAYAMLGERDSEKAKKIMDMFEQCAHTYPYPGDIESERELINMVDSGYTLNP